MQKPPKQPPQLRISGYAPAMLGNVYNYMGFRSFCFEQFCLDRSVANLMMLTINVCLMHDCFLVEKFYLHYALCDFDSILLHCTKLFSRQSIDREQIFDVTFDILKQKRRNYQRRLPTNLLYFGCITNYVWVTRST